MYLNINKTYHM